MPSLLTEVHKKMTITAHRRVRNVLEGEYGSVFKGRSMDFDDLREYIPGDDIKDIDWKATARSGQVLIKRYIAVRKHNILLVVATGRSLAASAPSGDAKRDVAVLAAGVIATVAQKHGDLIALAAGDAANLNYIPLKGNTAHVEQILQYIYNHAEPDGAVTDLTKVLDYVARTIQRRMMLIVISDSLGFDDNQQRLLRRLSAQHEIMHIGLNDLDPTDPNWSRTPINDVVDDITLPMALRSRPAIAKAFVASQAQQVADGKRSLEHLGISSIRIDSVNEVVEQIVRLLEKQKHVRR